MKLNNHNYSNNQTNMIFISNQLMKNKCIKKYNSYLYYSINKEIVEVNKIQLNHLCNNIIQLLELHIMKLVRTKLLLIKKLIPLMINNHNRMTHLVNLVNVSL
jgi:hypothetical protein